MTSPRAPEPWWDLGRAASRAHPVPGTLVRARSLRLLIHQVVQRHIPVQRKVARNPRSGSTTVLWGAECTVSPAEDGDGVGEELALFSPAGTKTHHMRGTEERTFWPAAAPFYFVWKVSVFSLTVQPK